MFTTLSIFSNLDKLLILRTKMEYLKEEEYLESFYDIVNEIEKEFNLYQKKMEEKSEAIKVVTNKYKNKLEEYKKYLKEENNSDEIKNKKLNEIKTLSIAFRNIIRNLNEKNEDIQTIMDKIQNDNEKLFNQVNNFNFKSNINNIPNVQNGIRKFKKKLEIYGGSILNEEPSYIVNYAGRKGDILVGFKNGTFAIGKLMNKNLGISDSIILNHGRIQSMLVLKGKYCYGFYLMCSEIKKTISVIHPSIQNDSFKMDEIQLIKIEDEIPDIPNSINEGIKKEAKVHLRELFDGNICAFYQKNIFLWQIKSEANHQFFLNKITLSECINNIIQIGKNKILALINKLNQFIIIDLNSLQEINYNLSEQFNISLCEYSNIIYISDEYFILSQGVKYELFKYKDENSELIHVDSFNKSYYSFEESSEKIGNDCFILCEISGEKKYFSIYRFSIKVGDAKFELVGGPYLVDVFDDMLSYCILDEKYLIIITKINKAVYIFDI